jgi:hypothetical protein
MLIFLQSTDNQVNSDLADALNRTAVGIVHNRRISSIQHTGQLGCV